MLRPAQLVLGAAGQAWRGNTQFISLTPTAVFTRHRPHTLCFDCHEMVHKFVILLGEKGVPGKGSESYVPSVDDSKGSSLYAESFS